MVDLRYFVGMRSSVRTLSSTVFTVCKILTFWLWNKVCLTVWNAYVRVRPKTKQVSTLFNQCKLYFGIQTSSRSLASRTVNGAVILVGGFSVKRRKSVICSISYVSLSYIFRKHVARNFWNCLSPDFSGTKKNSYYLWTQTSALHSRFVNKSFQKLISFKRRYLFLLSCFVLVLRVR